MAACDIEPKKYGLVSDAKGRLFDRRKLDEQFVAIEVYLPGNPGEGRSEERMGDAHRRELHVPAQLEEGEKVDGHEIEGRPGIDLVESQLVVVVAFDAGLPQMILTGVQQGLLELRHLAFDEQRAIQAQCLACIVRFGPTTRQEGLEERLPILVGRRIPLRVSVDGTGIVVEEELLSEPARPLTETKGNGQQRRQRKAIWRFDGLIQVASGLAALMRQLFRMVEIFDRRAQRLPTVTGAVENLDGAFHRQLEREIVSAIERCVQGFRVRARERLGQFAPAPPHPPPIPAEPGASFLLQRGDGFASVLHPWLYRSRSPALS